MEKIKKIFKKPTLLLGIKQKMNENKNKKNIDTNKPMYINTNNVDIYEFEFIACGFCYNIFICY